MQVAHETGTTLNHLREVCVDGQRGFEAAAKAITEPSLHAELIQYSQQRKAFAADLQAAITSFGESPSEGGSLAGAAHRGWMDLKATLSSNDRYAILAECERGEDAAIESYRDAMASNLPGSVGVLVDTQ
jgi:uncharacterized protein (TIGR02284 family)